jgi:hypothetical protein
MKLLFRLFLVIVVIFLLLLALVKDWAQRSHILHFDHKARHHGAELYCQAAAS